MRIKFYHFFQPFSFHGHKLQHTGKLCWYISATVKSVIQVFGGNDASQNRLYTEESPQNDHADAARGGQLEDEPAAKVSERISVQDKCKHNVSGGPSPCTGGLREVIRLPLLTLHPKNEFGSGHKHPGAFSYVTAVGRVLGGHKRDLARMDLLPSWPSRRA